jgi:hypothetical protein
VCGNLEARLWARPSSRIAISLTSAFRSAHFRTDDCYGGLRRRRRRTSASRRMQSPVRSPAEDCRRYTARVRTGSCDARRRVAGLRSSRRRAEVLPPSPRRLVLVLGEEARPLVSGANRMCGLHTPGAVMPAVGGVTGRASANVTRTSSPDTSDSSPARSSFAPVSSRSPDPLVCICNAGFGDQLAGERDCVARAEEAAVPRRQARRRSQVVQKRYDLLAGSELAPAPLRLLLSRKAGPRADVGTRDRTPPSPSVPRLSVSGSFECAAEMPASARAQTPELWGG